ncbi:MAG: hypothetical protein KTR33_13780 [Gammaproteobacteria bacterium]|nr:hypothetical protein [Gammaproteobacteria bacterium]
MFSSVGQDSRRLFEPSPAGVFVWLPIDYLLHEYMAFAMPNELPDELKAGIDAVHRSRHLPL